MITEVHWGRAFLGCSRCTKNGPTRNGTDCWTATQKLLANKSARNHPTRYQMNTFLVLFSYTHIFTGTVYLTMIASATAMDWWQLYLLLTRISPGVSLRAVGRICARAHALTCVCVCIVKLSKLHERPKTGGANGCLSMHFGISSRIRNLICLFP